MLSGIGAFASLPVMVSTESIMTGITILATSLVLALIAGWVYASGEFER